MIGVPVSTTVCELCSVMAPLPFPDVGKGVVVSSAVVWCGVSGEKERLVESDYRSTTGYVPVRYVFFRA